jgi:hypothetical protein
MTPQKNKLLSGAHLKRAATAAAIVIVAWLAWSIATRRPVLIHLPIPVHSIRWDTDYAVFNPLRDRAPEHVAGAYLEAMRRGDCSEAAKYSQNVVLPYDAVNCEQFMQIVGPRFDLNVFVQRFRDRSDAKDEIVLDYSDSGYERNWVILRRFGNSWKVVKFGKFW